MSHPLQNLFNTIQEIEAAGKVKLSADERAVIERETADLLRKSQMKNYRFASVIPRGFEDLLDKLKMADAEEAYSLLKDFMDSEEDHEGGEEKHEEEEKSIIENLDKGVEDLKDSEEKEEMAEIKEEVSEKKEKKPEKDEDKKDKDEKKEDKKDKSEDKGDDKPAFLEDKENVMARIKKRKAQDMPMGKKPEMDKDKDMPGKGPGDGPKMDGKGPHGPGKDKMKDLKDKKKFDDDKKPSVDEMGIEDKEIDPTVSLRASKIRVKVTAERNIIAYHVDHGPIFMLKPDNKTKKSKSAMVRLANRAYGLAVYEGFAVAARKLGAKMIHTSGVDDDVEVVTQETPETPEKKSVEDGAEDVVTGEEYDEKNVGDDTQGEADDDIEEEPKKIARYKVLKGKKRPRRAQDLGLKLDDWLGTASISDFGSEEEIRDYFTQENAENMWGPGEYFDAEEIAEYAVQLWKSEHKFAKKRPRRAYDGGAKRRKLQRKVRRNKAGLSKKAVNIPIEEVYFDVNLAPEMESPEGMFASGIDEYDKEDVAWVNEQLDQGNEWAWCQLQVIATWEDASGKEYTGKSGWLGACSYEDEKAFVQEGEYDDMKDEAYQDLLIQVEDSDVGMKGIRPARKTRRAAEGDITSEMDTVTDEKPDSKPDKVTEGDDDLAEESKSTPDSDVLTGEEVDFKTAKKIEANYRKLYASRLKKAEENFIRKFSRCMRIASKRMLLNQDHHPMKYASADVLMSEDVQFENGEYFNPMPEHIAVQLTELIATEGHEEFVTHLMDRTADLMEKSDEYLKDVEADIKNLKPVAVEVEASDHRPKPKMQARANSMRRAASTGNFGLTHKTATTRSSNTGSLRDAVRGSDFRVNRDLGVLKG